jgi:hypothetical protein
MTEKCDPENGVGLANKILRALHDTKVDPILGYAAIGCAFMQLHCALGFTKDGWIDTTKEMAEIEWEEK